MCSKNDSDATYCSEVEELTKATSTLKKSCKDVPVRRSQRLSQKLKVSYAPSIKRGVNVFNRGNILSPSQHIQNFAKNPPAKVNKCTQDIFNSQYLTEEQEILHPELYGKQYISLNSYLNCKKTQKDVPLDLSNKSIVSASQVEQDFLKVVNGIESCKHKNNIGEPQHNNKEDRMKGKRNQGRPAIKECCKSTLNKLRPIETGANQAQSSRTFQRFAEGRNKDLKNLSRINNNNSIILHIADPSKIKSGKAYQTINSAVKSDVIVDTTNKISEVQQKFYKNPNSNIELSKNFISLESRGNINPLETQPTEMKSFKRFYKTSVSNENIKCSTENTTSIFRKRFKSSNENITVYGLKKQAKLLYKNLKTSKIPVITQKKIEASEKSLNKTKPTKRFQKLSITDKKKHSTVELQDCIQHIKFDPNTTSRDIYSKSFDKINSMKSIQKFLNNINNNTNSTNNVNIMETSTKNLNTYAPQIKSETFTALNNYPKSFVNIKLQSTKTSNENEKLLKDNEINIDIVSEKFKSKVNSQKSSKKTKKIRTSQKLYFTRSSGKLSGEHTQKAESEINKLPNQFQSIKRNLKSSDETTATKSLNSSQRNKQSDENTKTKIDPTKTTSNETTSSTDNFSQRNMQSNENIKTIVDSTKRTLNKNYLKSFDKTQFLGNIQSSKSSAEKLSSQNCNYGKPNILQIPPTPADSTQDLMTKSILPDVYPPHFKYQLPPEAAMKCSWDAQPQSTYAITPDDTISSELLDSSSSSPSLPESLCELFHTKDIKHILNVERVAYRLYDYHLQALALILNLRLEYLRNMLDKVMAIRPNVLKNIDKTLKIPFVADYDLFDNTSFESWAGSDEVVFNSQSPKKQRRISTIGERLRC